MTGDNRMGKVNIGKQAFLYPMPMVIVGTEVEGKQNFMAVAWVTQTNYAPPIFGIAIGKRHHTGIGIRTHKEFSINIPSRDLLVQTDYVGIATGTKVDKSKVFETFSGELAHAPMITGCPITMECSVVQVADCQPPGLFSSTVAKFICQFSDQRFSVRS